MTKAVDQIHVLVADDQPDQIRDQVALHPASDDSGSTLVVDGREFHFHYVTTVAEALDTVRFSRVKRGSGAASLGDPDVVVLDLSFPEDNRGGLTLLHAISRMTPDVGKLMLTRFGSVATAFAAGAAHADRFLTKGEFIHPEDPLAIEKLAVELDLVVGMKRAQPELHDRKHKEIVDGFATSYDDKEQSFPATVAYLCFEDDVILRLTQSLAREGEPLRVLDVGCGTGRIEKLLQKELPGCVHVTAVDFCGRMLDELLNNGVTRDESMTLERGSAESLDLEGKPAGGYDLVLLAFGVPSYTKYHLSLEQAFNACRPGGMALFSVYNESSAYYEANARSSWADNEKPFAAIADRDTGKLNVSGEPAFACETFSCASFERLVKRFGFVIAAVDTFPTLHASLPRSAVEKLPDGKTELKRYPSCSAFSPTLYDLDVAYSRANPGRGHYILVTAQRPMQGAVGTEYAG